MKKLLVFALSTILGYHASIAASSTPVKSLDNGFEKAPNTWWKIISSKPEAKVELVSSGRTGKCLKIANTAKVRTQCGIYSNAPIPFKPTTDTLKLSFYAKGKGTLCVSVYAYHDKFIGMKPIGTISIDNSDSWQAHSMTFEGSKVPSQTTSLRLVFFTNPGNAEILLDDLTCTKESK